MKKRCLDCGEQKPLTDFNKDKNREDGLNPVCRECKALWFKRQYQKNKEHYFENNKNRRVAWKYFIDDIKRKCQFCDECIPEILDFHHIDSEEKDIQLSKFQGQSFNAEQKQRFLDEAKKCIIVCSNCHRKIHLGFLKI